MPTKAARSALNRVDLAITRWMARVGIVLFLPGASPAQELATRTIHTLSAGLVPASVSLPVLAAWECVGLGLLVGRGLRGILLLLYVQMLGTLTPILLFPHEVFTRIPHVPTLEGQYIIKNLVLISAGIVVGSTVRGGRIVPDAKGRG